MALDGPKYHLSITSGALANTPGIPSEGYACAGKIGAILYRGQLQLRLVDEPTELYPLPVHVA